MNLLALALLQSFSLGVPVAPPVLPAISVGLRPSVVEAVAVAVAVVPALDPQAQLVTPASVAVTGNEYPRTWPRVFEGRATGKYYGARYYRANVGRFTTVDPAMEIERSIMDPQNWNRYAYARNNPLRNVDPDGRSWVKVGKLILKGGDVASTFAGTIEAAAIPISSQGGADVRHVQKLLGHQSLDTTAIYTKVTVNDLAKALEKAHPREKHWKRKRSRSGRAIQ